MTTAELKALIGRKLKYVGGITGDDEVLAEQHLNVGQEYPVMRVNDGFIHLLYGDGVDIQVYEPGEYDGPVDWNVSVDDLKAGYFELVD